MSDSHDLIDADVFSHLVGLAALELDQEESEYLRRELNNQLAAIRELQAISDEWVPPAAHAYLTRRMSAAAGGRSAYHCENSAEIIARRACYDNSSSCLNPAHELE